MMKRIIALLLALILTVGLLPTVALAEDAPEEGGQTAASSAARCKAAQTATIIRTTLSM